MHCNSFNEAAAAETHCNGRIASAAKHLNSCNEAAAAGTHYNRGVATVALH